MVPRALELTAESLAEGLLPPLGPNTRARRIQTSSGPLSPKELLGNPSSSSPLRTEGEAAGDSFPLLSKGVTEE